MKSGFVRWIKKDKTQSQMQKQYYAKVMKKGISLLSVFNLLVASCFCFLLYTPNSRATSVNAPTYDWYTPTAGTQQDPYIINEPSDLWALGLLLNQNPSAISDFLDYIGGGTPKTLELTQIDPLVPETSGGGIEKTPIVSEPEVKPPAKPEGPVPETPGLTPIEPENKPIPIEPGSEPTTSPGSVEVNVPSQPAEQPAEQPQTPENPGQTPEQIPMEKIGLAEWFQGLWQIEKVYAETTDAAVETPPVVKVPPVVETPPVVENSTKPEVSTLPAVEKPSEGAVDGSFNQSSEVSPYAVTPPFILDGFSGKYFRVEGVINMSGFDGGGTATNKFQSVWIPIGTNTIPFNGTLQGAPGSHITDFYYYNDETQVGVSKSYNYYGLFGYVGTKGIVDNLTFSNVKFHVTDSRMNQSDSAYGVVAAFNSGIVKNCKIYAPEVVGTTTLAGIELPKTDSNASDGKEMKRATVFGGVAGQNESSGILANCTFNGNIHSNGELRAGTYKEGIGGICGRTAGIIANCIVKSDLTFLNAGEVAEITSAELGVGHSIYLGGIAGTYYGAKNTEDKPAFRNCLFTGSIKAKGERSYNAIGGIVGKLNNGYLNQCIVSAEIGYSGSSDAEYTGGSGQLVGTGSDGTISNSFAMGNLESGYYTGGLAGYGINIKNSYYTGSVRALESRGKDISGGLLGNAVDSSVYNSYFAGASLTPHTGSVLGCGTKSYTTADAVFYDSTISPNAAAAFPEGKAFDGMGKTTAELCSAGFSGLTPDVWTMSDISYPRLNWTGSISAGQEVAIAPVSGGSISVSQEYVNLVQNFSALSTAKWGTVNSGNSWGNAYQMMDSSFQGLNQPLTLAGLNLTGSAITSVCEMKEIEGLYGTFINGANNSNGKIGFVSKNRTTFIVEGVIYEGRTTRKNLYAAPQKGTDTTIKNENEFYKFLDYWQAGGGVLGAQFTVTADGISLSKPIKSLPDYNRGVFAGILEGQNNHISAVTFEPGARSLLGHGFGSTVKNLNFQNLAIGTATNQAIVDKNYFGLLFGQLACATVDRVQVDGYQLYLKELSKTGDYGGLIGDECGNSRLTNNTITRMKAVVGNYEANGKKYPDQELNRIKNFGGIAGKVNGSIENCHLKNADIYVDIYEGATNNDGCGGIVGYNGGSISNCSVTGNLRVSQFADRAFSSGGIAGFVNNGKNIYDSHFIGRLEGLYIGGVAGYTNHGAGVHNSYFAGEIIGIAEKNQITQVDYGGGIIGCQSNGAATVENCFAFGNIQMRDNAGGLIGYSVNDCMIQNSYVNGVISGKVGAGGLIGNKKNVSGDTFENSYFIGQTNSIEAQGGIVGFSPTGYAPKIMSNIMYDKQLTGRIKSLGSISGSADLGRMAKNITAGALNPGVFIEPADPSNYYPQMNRFTNSADPETKLISKLSTKKIFAFDEGAESDYLQGIKFSSITVKEIKDAGVDGYTAKVTPNALYYIEPNGTTKHAMMIRATGSDVYNFVPDNIYTEEGTLNVEYKIAGYQSVMLPYKAGLKAFDYGTGAETDPYIIYNESIFQDFTKFVSKGRDTQNTYYIIGSEPKGSDPGKKPITLNMTAYPFVCATGFNGNLQGNNSTMQNVTLPYVSGTIDQDTFVYQGIFGVVNATAKIENLTVKNITRAETPVAAGVYTGGLVGYAKGGSFDNILIESEKTLTLPSNSTKAYMGGLIGGIDGSGSLLAEIKDVTTIVDIQGIAGSLQAAGGLCGKIYEGSTNVFQSGAYGTIKDVKYAGGIAGYVNNVSKVVSDGLYLNEAVSMCDISYSGSDGFIGGFLGYNAVPKKNFGNRGDHSVGLNLRFDKSFYGGKLTAGAGNQIGGLVGKTAIVVETGQNGISGTLPDPITAKDLLGETADAQIKKFVAANITDTYYTYDNNPYSIANFEVYGHYTLYPGDHRNYYPKYQGEIKTVDTGRSSTWKLTTGATPSANWITSDWNFEKGVFPILSHKSLLKPSESTKVEDIVKFKSMALFLTRAGKVGEGKFQNAYITYTSPTTPAGISAEGMRITSNGAMAVATGANVPAVATLSWKNFTRTIHFTASTEPSGVPDFSWFAINPKGMWKNPSKTTIVTETDAGGAITTHTSIRTVSGWGLYTADQLQGLSLLNEAIPQQKSTFATLWAGLMDFFGAGAERKAIEDGNGVSVLAGDFIVPKDVIETTGSGNQITTKEDLWRIYLEKDLDVDIYPDFLPIGSQDKPFLYGFDGNGKILRNLHLNATKTEVTGVPTGLFGVASGAILENLGVASGTVQLEGTKAPTGILIGKMSNGSKLKNSFTSVGLFGDEVTAPVGGLVGASDGTLNRISIENSFYTGAIHITTNHGIAGGLAGRAENTDITTSYLAGYVEATTSGAMVGESVSGNNSYNNKFDQNASGSLKGAGYGQELPVTGISTDELIKLESWNSTWKNAAGYYPIQECFTVPGATEGAISVGDRAKVAVVPVKFLPSAKSVSTGEILYGKNQGEPIEVTLCAITWNTKIGKTEIARNQGGNLQFNMVESGVVWARLGLFGEQRDVLFNQRCWYDEGTMVDGIKTYTINSTTELAEFAAIVNGTVNQFNPNGNHFHGTGGIHPDFFDSFENARVRLGSSLDLKEIPNWKSIGASLQRPFKGTFDGEENLIINLNQTTATGTYAGLFGVVSGGAIQNVGIQEGRIATNATETGGLAAAVYGGKIENCFTSLTIESTGKIAGGLVGSQYAQGGTGGSINRSFSMSMVKAIENAGGIAGTAEGKISNSYNTGIVRAGDNGAAAGITSKTIGESLIDNCFAAGFIGAGVGGAAYGVAPAKVVAATGGRSSWYDSILTGPITAVSNVGTKTEHVDRMYTLVGATDVATKTEMFRAARTVSRVSMTILGVNYGNFSSAIVNRTAQGYEINMKSMTDIFKSVPMDNQYMISVADASGGGNGNVIASIPVQVNQTACNITKPYYLATKYTLAIRYEFDFSALEGSKVYTGQATGNVIPPGVTQISTFDQFRNLVTNINSGVENTAGKTYYLTKDLVGDSNAIPPIGTATNPFKGTFDGRGYKISNLKVSGAGTVGLFGYIDNSGKIKNLKIGGLTVTASKPVVGDIYAGGIAGQNKGSISNVGITGQLTVENANFGGFTYLGGIVGENKGRVEGCYFVQYGSLGIIHSSKTTDFAGGMCGRNQGSFTGCYVSSDMKNTNINALFGTTADGNFTNCYYNCGTGNENPGGLRLLYVYDKVAKESKEGLRCFVAYSKMNSADFAKIISSNLYGGTYKPGTSYVDLTTSTLMRKGYGDLNLMLSLRNIIDENALQPEDKGTIKSSFMNAISTYYNYDFPYFSNLYFNNKLQVDMPILPLDIDYQVKATVYDRDAMIEDVSKGPDLVTGKYKVYDVQDITLKDSVYTLNYNKITEKVERPKTIVLTLKLQETETKKVPWGVYRTKTLGQ